MIREAIKALLLGSPLFMILGLAFGVLLLFGSPGAARWGRAWLLGGCCLYFVLSLQGTSDLLVFGLSREYRPLRTAEDAQGARIIVVLGNGVNAWRVNGQTLAAVNPQTAYNALEAARVYRLLGDPLVLASGGPSNTQGIVAESEVMADTLQQLGVPRARVALESTSQTTLEQAVNAGAWLQARGETRFVLITAPEHMRRAVGLFTARGLHPIPSTSTIAYGGSPFWRPTGYALQGSEAAIYEYVAWCFYRVRGWL